MRKALEYYKAQTVLEGGTWTDEMDQSKKKELLEKVTKMNVKELVQEFGHFYPFRIDTLSKIMPYEEAFELHTQVTGWCYGPKRTWNKHRGKGIKLENTNVVKKEEPQS